MIDVPDALSRGFPLLAGWLRQAQRKWEKHAVRNAAGGLKNNRCVTWLDYRAKLRKQPATASVWVLYGRSGTNLAACVVERDKVREVGDSDAVSFIVDSTNHYAEFADLDEAHYVTAVLNSATVDRAIKPLQSRGLWGERDIYQLAWRLPIPRFDRRHPAHARLAELSNECHQIVDKMRPGLTARSPARRREVVRVETAGFLAEIDVIVASLLAIKPGGGGRRRVAAAKKISPDATMPTATKTGRSGAPTSMRGTTTSKP
jgi:hypothetical protein